MMKSRKELETAVDIVVEAGLQQAEDGGWYLSDETLRELTDIDLLLEQERKAFFDVLLDRPEIDNCFIDNDLSGIGIDFAPPLCAQMFEQNAKIQWHGMKL